MSHRIVSYEEFEVGRRASFQRTIDEREIQLFIELTGDTNPLHVDQEWSADTFLVGRIAHGLLTGSLLSYLIGMLLPGTGALYRSQTLSFLRPVRPGDTLEVVGEVLKVDAAAELLTIATWITNQQGDRVLEGEAQVTLLRKTGLRKAALRKAALRKAGLLAAGGPAARNV